MHKTAIGLAILLFLVIAALVLAPEFVDLDRFRAPLAANLSARLGRPVEFGGPIKLALLPRPTISLRNLRIANPPGAAVPDMVRLRAAEVKPALWPLLTGRIELRSATLIEPEIDLEYLPNGEGNWQGLGVARVTSGEAGATPRPVAAAIDHLTVQDGAVSYRTAGGVERFEHISGQAGFDSLQGRVSVKADLVARGAAFHVEAESGRWDAPDFPVQLRVASKPDATLRLDLMLSGKPDERQATGKLSFSTPDVQAVAAPLLRGNVPDTFARPLTLGAQVDGSWRELNLEHLTADFGSAHGEGALQVRPGTPLRLTLSLGLRRLDLDRWLAAERTRSEPTGRPGVAFAAERQAAPTPLIPADAWPAGIDATIELGAEAVLWRNGLLRDLRFSGEVSERQAKVQRFSAVLPGGSALSLRGSAKRTAKGWNGEGAFQARADDLRGLLSWYGASLDGIPPDRLGKATLAGRVAIEGERLGFELSDGSIDTTRFSGTASLAFREQPAVEIKLTADQINLDAYLPRGATDGFGTPAGVDFDIEAGIGTLTWEGQPLRDVHLGGRWQNGSAEIRELTIADVAGASAVLSGSIAGAATDSLQARLAIDMHGPEFERLLRLAAPEVAQGRGYGEFRLNGDLRFDGTRLSLDTTLAILQGQLHVAGELTPTAGKADLTFDLAHPHFADLAAAFAPGYRPAVGDAGALALAGHVAGTPAQFAIDRLSLSLGERRLSGGVAVDLTAARPRLNADLVIGDWVVDELLPPRQTAEIDARGRFAKLRSGVILAALGTPAPAAPQHWSPAPIDFAVLSLADIDLHVTGGSLAYGSWRLRQSEIAAGLGQGVLTVQKVAGTVFGGSLAAAGQIDGGTQALRCEFRLTGGNLGETLAQAGLSGVDGRYDLSGKLSTAGASPAELMSGLSGEAKLKGTDGTILGLNLKVLADALKGKGQEPDLLELMRAGASGRTAVSSFSGALTIAQGIARSENIDIATEAGNGRASLALDLPDWTMTGRAEFRFAGAADAPPLAVRLDGPVDGPHPVFEVAALERFLDRRASGAPRR